MTWDPIRAVLGSAYSLPSDPGDHDVTREQYRHLTDAEQKRIEDIKRAGNALIEQIDDMAHTGADLRCCSLARTKCEELVMWAVKGITK